MIFLPPSAKKEGTLIQEKIKDDGKDAEQLLFFLNSRRKDHFSLFFAEEAQDQRQKILSEKIPRKTRGYFKAQGILMAV